MAVSNNLFSSQGVYSQEFFMELCRPVLQILNLFQGEKKTKMLFSTLASSRGLENPHPFSDLASRPCAYFANPIGNLSNEDGVGNENGKKQQVFITKTTTLHEPRFFVHFFAVARLRRETSQFHVSWRTRTRKNDFLFLFRELDARRIF